MASVAEAKDRRTPGSNSKPLTGFSQRLLNLRGFVRFGGPNGLLPPGNPSTEVGGEAPHLN